MFKLIACREKLCSRIMQLFLLHAMRVLMCLHASSLQKLRWDNWKGSALWVLSLVVGKAAVVSLCETNYFVKKRLKLSSSCQNVPVSAWFLLLFLNLINLCSFVLSVCQCFGLTLFWSKRICEILNVFPVCVLFYLWLSSKEDTHNG